MRSKGNPCAHCVHCQAALQTYAEAAAQRFPAGLGEFTEWWPTGRNPVLYFLMHARKLKSCAAAHARNPKLWREAEVTAPSALAARRGVAPLEVRLPKAATNLKADDMAVQYWGSVRLQLSPPSSTPAPAGTSSAASCSCDGHTPLSAVAVRTARVAGSVCDDNEVQQPLCKRQRVA